jgi:hypothetical protein
MPISTGSRRRQRRYVVRDQRVACVEFEHPSPNGRHYRLQVVNLSASGVSFSLEGEAPELDAGTSLPHSVLRVGECMIRGDLVVMHLTSELAGLVCGALFYPETDTDLVKLKSVIAGMEAVESD